MQAVKEMPNRLPRPPLPRFWKKVRDVRCWESVVLGAKGDLFTLKCRDFPDERVFVRRRWQLAILHRAGWAQP